MSEGRSAMALTVGIIGLPNVGKSTLLNALASTEAEASNYPFCTIDSNKGVVAVPDKRLERLAEVINPVDVIPSKITFVDIAGLVKGASRGEGLGNKFLHHIREADVLAHVLRAFNDSNVSHIQGDIDPAKDLEIIETELFLSDIERVESQIAKEKTETRAQKKKERKDLEFLNEIRDKLSRQERINSNDYAHHKRDILCDLNLLMAKPVIFVINSGEDCTEDGEFSKVRGIIGSKIEEKDSVIISAKVESEISKLPDGEKGEYMEALGIDGGAIEKFIEKCHNLLGLIRYYTKAKGKLQAWSIRDGTLAPQAAGKIHSDMENGFIRAKVMNSEDLISLGNENELKKKGLLRTEGHDYIIRDGDVIEYLFNG